MGNDKSQSQTSTNPSSGKPDHVAYGTNEETKAVFKAGMVYKGTIESVQHNDNVYGVTISGISGPPKLCEWGVGLITNAFLGYKVAAQPTLGTGVFVLAGKPNVIIGTYPLDQADLVSGNGRIATPTGIPAPSLKTGSTGVAKKNSVASDLLEGEFAIENGLGPALQFLTNLIQLKGSERAKVEAHLMNDMVRVISETYKHFSAFGDYQIYNDGGLNVVWEGTSREFESQGLLEKDQKKATTNQNEVEFTKDLIRNARWRFSTYVGFLGDFIHVFVTDPSSLVSNIGEALRAGKSRFWQGSDGTCLLQSVTEISIERVVRIPVPQERKRWDDPTGVLKTAWDAMVNSQKAFTKVWSYGAEYRNIHEAAFQLREYARWLNCYHSYARFHQYDEEAGEWRIPNEDEIAHTWTNKEKDVEAANPHLAATYDTYACIRIMRDGAIILWDGYGSSVTMSRRMIQLSAPRHITIDAGGDISLIAGNDVYIRARRNVEIIATVGSFIAKARTAWKALCEWGSMWLKSDAPDPNAPGYVPQEPDDPSEDPKPQVLDAALILDTSKGATTITSARQLTLQTDTDTSPDHPADPTDLSKSILIQSGSQDVRIVGTRSTSIKAIGSKDGVLSLDCNRAITGTTSKFLLDCGLLDVNQKFTIKGETVNASQILAESVASQGPLYGAKVLEWVNPTQIKCCFRQHTNHVLTSKARQAPKFAEADDIVPLTNYKNSTQPFVKFTNKFAFTWKMPNADYSWKYISSYPTESGSEKRFAPLAQQRIEFDADISGQYKNWDMTSDNLKQAPRTSEQDVPFPGKGGRENEHISSKSPLHKVFTEAYKDQNPDIQTPLTSRAMQRKFLKPSTNK